jgi:hypothetical protein
VESCELLLAQWLEHPAFNRAVASSNLAGEAFMDNSCQHHEAYVSVKCFQTQNMPEDVLQQLYIPAGVDYGEFWVDSECDDKLLMNWLIENGAKEDEHILIVRGTWD